MVDLNVLLVVKKKKNSTLDENYVNLNHQLSEKKFLKNTVIKNQM